MNHIITPSLVVLYNEQSLLVFCLMRLDPILSEKEEIQVEEELWIEEDLGNS